MTTSILKTLIEVKMEVKNVLRLKYFVFTSFGNGPDHYLMPNINAGMTRNALLFFI